MLYKSREAVIKLFNDYFSIAFEDKYKTTRGTGLSGMLDGMAKVSDREVSDALSLKILTPKQILQKLSIALAEVKAGNTSENLLNDIHQIIYFSYEQERLRKSISKVKLLKNDITI